MNKLNQSQIDYLKTSLVNLDREQIQRIKQDRQAYQIFRSYQVCNKYEKTNEYMDCTLNQIMSIQCQYQLQQFQKCLQMAKDKRECQRFQAFMKECLFDHIDYLNTI